MRWSLIISISTTLLGLFTSSAYGLVIPTEVDDGLASRAVYKKNPLSQGSSKDRKASYKHRHSYAVQKDKHGMKKWQAGMCNARPPRHRADLAPDHIFEKQMVHGHLKENGLKIG